ncbi:HET-domain-containing protein, partial [Mytilinidion resinicola]
MLNDLFLGTPALNYRPLSGHNMLRLLELRPGNRNDPICCHFREVSITSPLLYNALSYNWGSSTERIPILCDDAVIEVTCSLFTALNRLRDPVKTLTIWVDALCINQGDLEEKRQQVKMMRNIYAKANTITVWLG